MLDRTHPEPCDLTLAEASTRIAGGRLTARGLVDSCLARIARLDPVLNAWVALDAARARAAADAADAAIAAGRRCGPLHGIPYGLKDILRTAELPTRAASRLAIADDGAEAMVHRRLRQAGAILLGKLNTYEFGTGTGAVYDDLPVPAACNPWNPDRFTGGSSTGAGAAVAARMVPFAIGTDTGGSVRLPAAACGLVGLKATYDLVSRAGMLPNCPSQDHVGPLTRTAADAALVLRAIAERPLAEPAGSSPPRIAVVRGFHSGDPMADPAIAQGFERAVAAFAAAGAAIVERDVAWGTRDFRACARVINASESFAIHRHRLDGNEGMGTALRDKLEAAAALGAADYVDALRWRRTLAGAVVAALDGCDALLCAGTMTTAPRLDDEQGCRDFTGNSAMAAFNLAGLPALSLPVGFDGDGLPLNVQLAGDAWGDLGLLRLAGTLEGALGLAYRPPPDPDRPPGAYARPPAAPERAGRAAQLARGMAESVARLPRPLPDTLEPAHRFRPFPDTECTP
jgi:aspartyl-tRNA(Asn)/glutamyl-tRNA(Gln) amidotransferase subunit A